MKQLPDRHWVARNQLRQENFADVVITPDAPTLTASLGINRDLDTFDKCLAQTRIWLREYADGRQRHASRNLVILNVLQGRTHSEWNQWFDEVKQFQADFHGWAFAGDLRADWPFVIDRILMMLEGGWLDRCPWLHWLGLGSVSSAVILTAIRDGIRQATGNYALEISFDDSMSSVAAPMGWDAPALPLLGRNHAVVSSIELPDDRTLVGSDLPFSPANSPLARRMTVGQVCHRTSGKSTWDKQS
jgi:hypothetical protein